MVEIELLSKQRSPSLILNGLAIALVATCVVVLAIVLLMQWVGVV